MTSDLTSTTPKPFIFVLMPFEAAYDDIYKFGIKGAADDVGAYAERLDEQIFSEGMLERIFNQISKADVIVADLTGRNPNVFYEVGYAHALGKLVVLLTKEISDIPFDLKHRQHTVYGGSIDVLRRELAIELRWAIEESRRPRASSPNEFISLRILDIAIPRTGSGLEIPTIIGSTANDPFWLPFAVRNDAYATIPGISHVYLFCDTSAGVIPCKLPSSIWSPSWSGAGASDPIFTTSITSIAGTQLGPPKPQRPIPLAAIAASTQDAPDGLTQQFRLGIAIPPLPPGAVEEESINLMFRRGHSSVDASYRLRLHTAFQYHDYPFRLKIQFVPDEEATTDASIPEEDGD